MWSDGGCYGIDKKGQCKNYTLARCPERCDINWEFNTCDTKPCVEHYNEVDCAIAGCQWDTATNICFRDPVRRRRGKGGGL